MYARKNHWNAVEWARFFEKQTLPVMPRSKILTLSLQESAGEKLSPKSLLDVVLQDPCLCLILLGEVRRKHRQHSLDRDSTTALSALLQLGVDAFIQLLLASPEIEENEVGLLKVETRAHYAAKLALSWATGRGDINPEEIAVAALLAGIGDLLLWIYAPEIPRAVADILQSGSLVRSSEAQLQVCGFTFKSLTLECAKCWDLPPLVIQLLEGRDSTRAQLTRTCSNAARHILDESQTANLALATDIARIQRLLPNAPMDWIIKGLTMIPETRQEIIKSLASSIKLDEAGHPILDGIPLLQARPL